MGSENNMVAVPERTVDPTGFKWPTEAEWQRLTEREVIAVLKAQRDHVARLAQPDAQQGASSPASGEGVERYALIAECAFDDRPRSRAGHHSDMDWTDGYRDGTRAAAAAIRAATPLAAATQPAVPQEGHSDLAERLRAAVTYEYMPMKVRKLLSEAAAALTGAGENGEQGA